MESEMVAQTTDVDGSSRKALAPINKRGAATGFHPTDEQVRQRISFVIELLLSGWAESDVTAAFYRVDTRVVSIMIEVNRALYMDESSGEKKPRFSKIKTGLGELCRGLIDRAEQCAR